MGTLRVYDFDGVLIPDGKNHNNVIVRAIERRTYPKGVSDKMQAYELLKANPLGKEARGWVDQVFREAGVRFVKSDAFKDSLNHTAEGDGTSIIVSASAFEGVINYMLEKEGLSNIIAPEYVFTVDNSVPSLIPGLKAEQIKNVAVDLGHPNIVFLDDNIKNVKEVAKLDGTKIDGIKLDGTKLDKWELFTTAIKVDPKFGVEDSSVLTEAKEVEDRYNTRIVEAEEEHIYVNVATEGEHIYANVATGAEHIYEDVVATNRHYANLADVKSDKKAENQSNDQLDEVAAAKTDVVTEIKDIGKAKALTKKEEREQIKSLEAHLKSVSKESNKSDPKYKVYEKSIIDKIEKLKARSHDVENKSNFLTTAFRNMFKGKKTEQDLKLSHAKRKDTLRKIHRESKPSEIPYDALVSNLNSSSDSLSEAKVSEAKVDFSKFTKSSAVKSEVKPALAPKKQRKVDGQQVASHVRKGI